MASPKSSSSSAAASPPEESSVVRVLDSIEPLVTHSSSVPARVQVIDSSEPLVYSISASEPIAWCSSSMVQVMDSSEPLVHGDGDPLAGPSSATCLSFGATVSSDEGAEAPSQGTESSGRRIRLYSQEVLEQWNLRKIYSKFSTVEACVKFAEERELVPTSKICKVHRKPMKLKRTGRQLGSFKCLKSNCRSKTYSQTLGTWFEQTRLPLPTIFEIMYMFAHNMPYETVRRETAGVGKNTVLSIRTISDWYSYCRETIVIYELERQREQPMIGGPGKIVQIDESMFGKRKYNRGQHIEGHWLIGMVEDQSKDLRLEVCPNNERSADFLIPIIKKHVQEGSTIHTDFWRAYDCLSEHGYVHKKVNHSDPENRFVAPDGTNTQRIESCWGGLKKRFQLANYKGYFEDWLVERSWRRRLRLEKKDNFEALLEAIKYVYKI